MSSSAIALKRLRRCWEPDEKAWNDTALEVPWDDVTPPLHKATLFALRNVFFFSHATAVQAQTIRAFSTSGHSVIVEAPTGSGKTLAVLIPLMERTVRACDAFVALHSRPLLRRDIIGVILSPSRALAEQTFVVGRNLSARYPHAIRFALCDGAVEAPRVSLLGLRAAARGAGTFLVATPRDLAEFVAALSEDSEEERQKQLLDAQDEETRRRYFARKASAGTLPHASKSKSPSESPSESPSPSVSATVQLRGCHEERFVVVVDEADLVFNSPEMREHVMDFVESFGRREEPRAKRRRTAKEEKKQSEQKGAANAVSMDLAFVGATVSTSSLLQKYASESCASLGSQLHSVVLNSGDDFVAQLQNRFALCEAHDFLPFLIQMMNIHASKKHFVFFNSAMTLLFVEKLFSRLTEGDRPLLFVKHIFVMYDGMSEQARLEQYNAFLTHQSNTTDATRQTLCKKKTTPLSAAEKKNQIYSSGWKRDGRAPEGKGAILLCTDMAAFGLDVRDVDYVYHFEPPTTVQSYVHRIGRVGRMGMRGSSILILPCFGSREALVDTRERKMTSVRFNTVANTRSPTAELQISHVTDADISEEKRQYLKDLGEQSALQPCVVPPFAPITSTVRNTIAQSKKLSALARSAAMSMCVVSSSDENAKTWFDPKLAIHALLLD